MALWDFERDQIRYLDQSEIPPDLYTPTGSTQFLDFEQSINELDRVAALGLDIGHFSAPCSMVWELTGRCPLQCVFCSGSFRESLVGELDADEKKALARELTDAKIWAINLSGGEPLLCPELPWLVDHFTSKEVPVCIITSGWGLKPELAKRLALGNSVAAVVSMDAPDFLLNDELRGRAGAHEAALRAIDLLLDAGLPLVSVECVITQKNLHHMEQMVELCQARGVHMVRFQPVVMIGRGNERTDLQLSEAQLTEMSESIRRIRDTLYQRAKDEAVPARMQVTLVDQATHVIRGMRTGINLGGIVRPDGRLKPSDYVYFSFGDVRTAGGFMNLWRAGFCRAWRHPALREALGTVRGIKDLERVAASMNHTCKDVSVTEIV